MNHLKKLHNSVSRYPFFILFFAAVLVFSSLSPAHAAELNLKTEKTTNKNFLSGSFEMVTFQVESESVGGSGLKLDFGHHFEYPFQIDLSFFTAINGAESQVSFSGLGASLYYDVFGNCCETVTTTYLGAEKIAIEKTPPTSSLQAGFGIDQFYLNGTKNVYSSSGINVGAAYKFSLFDFNFKASGRYSMMTSNKQKIQAYFFGLGIIFNL